MDSEYHGRKKRCSVLGCGSDSTDPTLKFFHFPRNPDRIKIWKDFCANSSLEQLTIGSLCSHRYVCSRHFNSAEFVINSRRSLRQSGADPYLKFPADHTSSPSHSPSKCITTSSKTIAPITAQSLTQKFGPPSAVSASSVASDGVSSDDSSSDSSSFDCPFDRPSFSVSVQPNFVDSMCKDSSSDHNYSIQLLHSPLVMKMKPGPQNEAIKPISWLLGTWLSKTGCGSFPNITPFRYNEEITFKSVGQPMMNYSAVTWHPIKQIPMHLETGFLRINPGTKNLALMTAHNFGVTVIEEGIVDEDEKRILLKSTKIERMSFSKGPAVTKTEREIGICDGKLKQVFKMETEKTPLTVHLVATYDKMSD